MRPKLIILDFDGPINNLSEAKTLIIHKLAKKLRINFPDRAVWNLINYIDQVYENERLLPI